MSRMNKKVIMSSIVASLIVSSMLGISSSAADEGYLGKDIQNKWENFEKKLEGDYDFKKGKRGIIKGLTQEERESLKEMSDEEKEVFLKQKKAEKDAIKQAKKEERKAHENVIDKLLAGEVLTQEEENLRSEIIEKRAERKAKREALELKKQEIQNIIAKKRSGVELTQEEEDKLDEAKEFRKNKKREYFGEYK